MTKRGRINLAELNDMFMLEIENARVTWCEGDLDDQAFVKFCGEIAQDYIDANRAFSRCQAWKQIQVKKGRKA